VTGLTVIKILIVEDDPMVREIHRKFISALEGFLLVGEAGNGKEALEILQSKEVDLIIMDIFMPQMDGIKALKAIRKTNKDVDVIVISAAQGGAVIKEAARLGAYDYLIKPFNYERFTYSLLAYKRYVEALKSNRNKFTQEQVDGVFQASREARIQHLPKGLHPATLKKVTHILRETQKELSSDEMAAILGVSRVTARRYLEYLVSQGKVVMEPVYQETGRPVNKYKILY
jgi:two-component system, CitB family, response regulator DctR